MEKEKSVLRNKSIGTKMSDEEYGELEKLAEARGLTLSEWFREGEKRVRGFFEKLHIHQGSAAVSSKAR